VRAKKIVRLEARRFHVDPIAGVSARWIREPRGVEVRAPAVEET
jgi:hypothetical protein